MEYPLHKSIESGAHRGYCFPDRPTTFAGVPFTLRMIPTELRKYGRASLTLIVFRWGEGSTRHLFGYATNLSAGGLFIPSINPRNRGEQFPIAFQTPGSGEWAVCRCEVVRKLEYDPTQKQKPGFGVKFLDLPEKTEKVIEKWVESRYS